jgi:hypothetical protein
MNSGRKKTTSDPVTPKIKVSKSAPTTPSKAQQPLIGPISIGAGMTAGLEIWRQGTQFVLVDRSADGRFADDVITWGAISSRGGLNGTYS